MSHQDCDARIPFALRCKTKNNKEKIKSFNKKHNEKTKCINSHKRMQYDINNSRLENKDQN